MSHFSSPNARFSSIKLGYEYLSPMLKAFNGRVSLEMHARFSTEAWCPVSTSCRCPELLKLLLHQDHIRQPQWQLRFLVELRILSPSPSAQSLEQDTLINVVIVLFHSAEPIVGGDIAAFLRRDLQLGGRERELGTTINKCPGCQPFWGGHCILGMNMHGPLELA